MNKKDRILELRLQGKTYNEIAAEVPCSKSTVCYYLGEGQQAKTRARSLANPKDNMWWRLSNFKARQSIRKGRNYTGDITRLGYWKARDFQRRIMGPEKLLSASDVVKAFSFDDVVKEHGPETHCYLTGRKIDLSDPSQYQFDHIIPVSKGGDNSIGNLGIAHPDANYAKGNLSVEEFVTLCREVVDWYESGLDSDTEGMV